MQSFGLGSGWGVFGQEYSCLISKSQHNFTDVLTAFHAGMGGARLRKWKG
jgi:hypothetical protein